MVAGAANVAAFPNSGTTLRSDYQWLELALAPEKDGSASAAEDPGEALRHLQELLQSDDVRVRGKVGVPQPTVKFSTLVSRLTCQMPRWSNCKAFCARGPIAVAE